MTKGYSLHDQLLQKINQDDFYAFTQSSTIPISVINRLRAEGLISDDRQKSVYRLTKTGYEAVELGGFENWLRHQQMQSTNQSRAITVNGDFSITNSNVNLLSDSAYISDSTEVLLQLEGMINLLKENQRMDGFLKERLVEINEKLHESIQAAKKDRLPILDNLISITLSVVSLASSFAV